MAKQRLVDFRGGINRKISPHMIGDSQGQEAQDVDSSSVRLEGRLLIDTSEKAEGSYFYESGNLSSNTFEGRWVSIYPEDSSTYLTGATDFAVWNKDLYVAFGENSANGQLQVYRDGSTTATQVNFDEPGTSSYNNFSSVIRSGTYSQTGTALTLTFSANPNLAVGDTITVDFDPTANRSSETLEVATVSASFLVVTATSDTDVGSSAQTGNFTLLDSLATFSRDDNSEILIASVTGQAYVPPQTGIYPVTQQAGTGEALISAFDPVYSPTSPLYDSTHSRNTYTKNNTTYYENPSTYRLQQNTGGSAAYTVNLSTSTVSQFSPVFSPSSLFYDTRSFSGVDTQTFNTYTRNSTTYYVPTANNTNLGVYTNHFYTQGGGTSYQSISLSLSTYSDSGFNPAYTNLNATYNDRTLRPYTGVEDYTFSHTFSRNGTTYYYASTANSTLNLQAGKFYRISSTGTTTTSDTWSAEQMQLANSDGTVTMYGNYQSYTALYIHYSSAWGNWRAGAWVNPPSGTAGAFNTIWTDSTNYSSQSAFESAYSSSGNRSSFTGTDNNVYRRAGASRAVASGTSFTIYYYGLQVRTGTTTTGTNNTYSLHTNSYTQATSVNYTYSQFTPYSQSFPSTFTYQDITDTVPAVTGIPDTPAFTYDDARTKLYLLYNSSSDVGNETTDNAQGYNWLQQGRAFSLADNGYYLRTLREDVTSGTGLPVVSGDRTLATLASGSSHVFGLSLDSTPQRLNFSIVQPTDVTNPAFKGYKLERIDNESSVDLGYIAPDSNVSFSYNSTTKAITITGLGTTASDNYRLKFAAYQDTQVRTTLNSGTAVTAKSNMSGVLFNGNDTFTIQLIDGTDTRFRAADFWLEKKVIEGTTATTDDIYAIIRCFDLFDRNSNAIQSGVITGVCDFLDAFPNGLSSGGLSSGATQSGVPTYLKFLKEANNFFFAVGTESTPDNRYGSANNKADSFLFVSEYNNPRSWPLTGYVEFDASITGLASYPGELIAWTPSGTFRVTGSRYDQMRKSRLATTEGMPIGHHRSIAQVGRYLVWVSQSGICFYDGDKVTNLTRGRFPTWTMQGNGLHAGQYDDTYYVVDSTETGYAVDFALEGFPVTEIDLTEGSSTTPSNSSGDTLPPVLVYTPSENKLYSRRGVIEGSQNRGSWSYKTRAFDGGSFGSLKLVRNVTLNGTGSGQVQVYLDGKPAFVDSNGASSPQTVQITSTIRTEPARIYLPAASADTQYGLNMADVWSVEIINWSGKVDWIDTEYEIISGA